MIIELKIPAANHDPKFVVCQYLSNFSYKTFVLIPKNIFFFFQTLSNRTFVLVLQKQRKKRRA